MWGFLLSTQPWFVALSFRQALSKPLTIWSKDSALVFPHSRIAGPLSQVFGKTPQGSSYALKMPVVCEERSFVSSGPLPDPQVLFSRCANGGMV